MGMISGLIKFLGNLFGWMKDRQELNNSPEMKKAVSSQKEADAVSRSEKAVVNEDVAAVRKELAE